MGRSASPEAIVEVRRHRPDLDELPDEAVGKLAITAWAEFELALRACGRALVAAFRR